MILYPNAKVNLGLDIVRRRADGYHDISTVFYPINLTDILEVVPATGSDATLTTYGRHIDCPVEKNLVMKAYRLMQREFGAPPVDIYLTKIIPDGAGLGEAAQQADVHGQRSRRTPQQLHAAGYERQWQDGRSSVERAGRWRKAGHMDAVGR